MAWVRRSWKPLAAGAVVVCVIIGLALWYAVSGVGRASSVQHPDTGQVEATSTLPEMQADMERRSLDGEMVVMGLGHLPSYGVMIDNHPDARPQSGLAQASLVYEIPVEGGLTRFMAVFDASSTVDQIGPVRSARLYFEELADGLEAVYAHVGGSPEALDQAKTWKGFRDLNEFYNGGYFWRSKSRAAPHNVYTKVDLLRDAFVKKAWENGSFVPWKYVPDAFATTTQKGMSLPSISYPAELPIRWTFDPSTGSYERTDGKTLKKDLDGTVIEAKNVVILETEGSVIDDYGRLKIRTTGKGQATVYRDGKEFHGVWKRVQGEHLRFETIDGADLLFRPGPTWIQVVLPGMTSGTSTQAVP